MHISSSNAGKTTTDSRPSAEFQSLWCFSATGILAHDTPKSLRIIQLQFGTENAQSKWTEENSDATQLALCGKIGCSGFAWRGGFGPGGRPTGTRRLRPQSRRGAYKCDEW